MLAFGYMIEHALDRTQKRECRPGLEACYAMEPVLGGCASEYVDDFAHKAADGLALSGGHDLQDGVVGRGEIEADGGDVAC